MALTLLGTIVYALFYVIARPLARRFFSHWPLNGIPAGIILGGLLYTWIIWLLMHFGFAMNTGLAWFFILFFALVSLYLDRHFSCHRGSRPEKSEFRSYVITFVAFWVLTSIYISLRTYNADFVGLEKFPDLAFVTSSFKTTQIPPLDPFASGETINYYYLGHFHASLIAHLTHRLPFEYFHFQVGNIFALSALILFVVGGFLFQFVSESHNRVLTTVSGLLAVFFGILSGNLQAFYEKFVMGSQTYFYPTATRYIENVIHEFPYYSFLVGDLHGHLMNLPNAVWAVGLCALFLNSLREVQWDFKSMLRGKHLALLLLIAFSAGTSYLVNAWDIMTTLLLAGVVMLAFAVHQNVLWTRRAFLFMTAISAVLVVAAIFPYLPYWLTFSPPSQGIGLVPPVKSSPFGQLVLIWGVHLPFAAIILGVVKHPFTRAVSILGMILIFLLEFIYLKDIYPTHFRANTVFKVGFQIWLWFSLLSAVAIAYIYKSDYPFRRSNRYLLSLLAGLLVGGGAFYTIIGVHQALLDFNRKVSLDGRDVMRRTSPEDVLLIDYINEKLPGQRIILEALGDSFSDFGRVSAFTGNPTIIQWFVHEWLWRGSYDKPFKPVSQLSKKGFVDTVVNRIEDVRRFYEAKELSSAKEILDKYGVEYFVIGRKEREKYPTMNESLLAQLGEVVFQQEPVRLFKVKSEN